MAFADAYRKQVGLLIRTLPAVVAEECSQVKRQNHVGHDGMRDFAYRNAGRHCHPMFQFAL